jgi:signal transduction histidine kinase
MGLVAILWIATTGISQTLSSPNIRSLDEMQLAVMDHGSAIRSFQLEAMVCAVVRERREVVLQDQTATLLVKLPIVDDAVNAGDWVALFGTNCLIARDRYGIQISNVVVDNDRRHSSLRRVGSVYLEAGFQPICVEWFNGIEESVLKLEYAGPGFARQKVPAAALWRKAGVAVPTFEPGLDFAAYNGDWEMLPNFANLNPVSNGMATNVNLTYTVQREHTGLIFNGFIRITTPGIYTFYLTSDDGARLEIGHPAFSCSVKARASVVVPRPETFDQARVEQTRFKWVELEGEVAFAGEEQGNLQMHIIEQGNYLPVTVIEGASLLVTNLLHLRVRVEGISEFSQFEGQRKFAGLIVPSQAQMQIYPATRKSGLGISTNDLLVTAAQVRRLKPEQTRLGIRVEISGVVIAASPRSLVLQDASGGVFVAYAAPDSFAQPVVGQVWKIKGRTALGDFAPVIYADKVEFLGNAAMPEPFRPTRDQLMNGSLDAEFVELHGVVTALSDTEMTLLTPEGKVTVRGDDERPLPQVSTAVLAGGSLVGNVVRIRGCFTANYNRQTGQESGGTFNLYPAVVEVEEPVPQDPFSQVTGKASDLLRFDASASSLERVKLAGQVIHTRAGECFLMDGQTGVRVLMAEAEPLRVGDVIEAVGFPQLEGSGLVLQAARVRPTGQAPLPKAVKVSAADLLSEKRNATLVEIQAQVISDARQLNRRVLELQAGPYHFLANLTENGENSSSVSPGSRVQLTGVYSSAREDMASDSLDPFELLLNSDTDIFVLQQPPWWTVRRAITVAAVLAGGLGATMIWIVQLRRKVEERTVQLQMEIEERQSVEQRRMMELERTRVAQDLHDELGVGLTQVGLLGSLAKNPGLSTERKNLYLDQLSDSARMLVAGLDEIVWAINPQYDSVSSLGSYFALFAQRLLNLAGIACRFDMVECMPAHPLDSRLRHGIFLAFKEALNNVVRHSGATEVRLSITIARDQLMITITDNGRGFAGSPGLPGSDGLAGMRQRMEKLGGQCVINSQLGQGTMVELNLPLGKNGA